MTWACLSRGQCGQRRVSTPTVAELCLQRSGAQGPKPRRAFDEAGKQHSFQEERCAVFPFFVWRQTTPLFMRTTSHPHAHAHRGLHARACTCRGACLSCRRHYSCQWRCPCSMTCRARAHEARARPRSPRARQRRSLAGGTDADRCMPFVFSLACMPCDVVSDLHAACHAKCRSLRCAGP